MGAAAGDAPQMRRRRPMSALRSLDAFSGSKVSEDFIFRTASGGAITVVAYAVMVLLFITETRAWPCAEDRAQWLLP